MKSIISVGILSLGFLLSCSKSTDPVLVDTFDRKAFLENYADSYIIPGFQTLSTQTTLLNTTINDLSLNSDLSSAKQNWKVAYEAFLHVTLYNIGPAEEQVLTKSLVEEVATFPINTEALSTAITSGNYQVGSVARDLRGFLALEYLLFSEDAQGSDAWLAVVKAIAQDINERVADVNSAWPTFRETFVNNNGTSAGSSTSAIYNEFLKSFEALKNFKLGLPLGLRPGQTEALPGNVESPYSENNLLFSNTHFQVLKSFWEGNSGLGFREYLLTVEGGEALVNSTELQIKEVETAFLNVNETDFEASQLDGNQNLIALHTELQKLTRFFKSEMSSLLGIAITFSSGDGD
ncbi:imelysin family protein [Arcticibacterium luteifluviistationis]|uniref:Imelysin-like domain-containing protein n=1 Tax=Arcticibacterium luteifluviistationis TaxID=1784714 RepID=A0A2Z4G9B0_9BACT|nr:imelysin family protein [Arcticibacterium luteifluviistationis]AWV97756.1 hypothetical protein DJ013_06075 [Arcticibacterium luteifluviistationis]